MNPTKLSKLQKRILEQGLRAWWRAPIGRAWGFERPGSFIIDKILLEFYCADKADIDRAYIWRKRGDQRVRLACPRAALSRAMSRLTKRGLLERSHPTGLGSWRLTALGVEVAAALHPELQGPSQTELYQKITEAFHKRKARSELSDALCLPDFIAHVLAQTVPPRKGVEVTLEC